ncbi:uncharacterized protein LACBIDRAFT_294743 [Laccaria bicolor S238N-H82]|uniref:Predicted protein n=1 Tax=Laccaria bicolor (strain S238N-H82 / ATCC MYA-4686) TaxID=486041 RepID=B0DHF3_LACBS|nr:uncharacterized protein LACBIDRAFT_294743 [Laccaria bicolor S238N-H82]EDR06008.1 predicted protein [Laccaria bicolor S238N-H82]|eukprot:XP_001883296.1 predicted protein [Laccaria bicolor S238N-H82]
MPTLHRNHSIASTVSDRSPAQYESFEAPYKSSTVRPAGYNRRLSSRRSQGSSRGLGLDYPYADGVATPSRSPSLSLSCASLPPDSPASTIFGSGSFRRGSTQSNISSASTDYSRRGSTQFNLSQSTSHDFWNAFFNSVAVNKFGPEFTNARLVYDALVKEFPNGLPTHESCMTRGPDHVEDYEEFIRSSFWCCRNCFPLKSFSLQALHNSPLITMEAVDCGPGGIADYAVTLDNLGGKRYWAMTHPEVCPCGGVV